MISVLAAAQNFEQAEMSLNVTLNHNTTKF